MKEKGIIVNKNSVTEQSFKAKHLKNAKMKQKFQNDAKFSITWSLKSKWSKIILKYAKKLKQKLIDAKKWCKKDLS